MQIKHVVLMAFLGLAVLADDEKPSLNNGQKWVADQATHAGITEIDRLVHDAGAYTHDTLVGNLEKEIRTIISKCSMKGEAHDQLHKVLHPIIGDVAALKAASTPTDRQAALASLKNRTKTYFEFFQGEKQQP